MKKILIAFLIAGTFISCNGQTKSNPKKTERVENKKDVNSNQNLIKLTTAESNKIGTKLFDLTYERIGQAIPVGDFKTKSKYVWFAIGGNEKNEDVYYKFECDFKFGDVKYIKVTKEDVPE